MDNQQDAARRCKCDLTAVSRTVQKEGPNQGRTFWTCPNSENARCGFFEWDDGVDNGNAAASGSSLRPARVGESSTPGASGSNACYKCGAAGHFASGMLPSTVLIAATPFDSCRLSMVACTNPGSQARSQTVVPSGGGSSRSCFKCGEEGHFSNGEPLCGDEVQVSVTDYPSL